MGGRDTLLLLQDYSNCFPAVGANVIADLEMRLFTAERTWAGCSVLLNGLFRLLRQFV